MIKPSRFIVVLLFFLAACGSTAQDRAVSGGGIGAAGGAIIGAVTGLTVLEGALIGTGLGAALGGLTDADKFDLGKPIWKQSTKPARTKKAANYRAPSQDVMAVQKDLKRLGYDPGPIDGILGPKTKAAIAQFEKDHGHPPGGDSSTLAGDTKKLATSPPENSRN